MVTLPVLELPMPALRCRLERGCGCGARRRGASAIRAAVARHDAPVHGAARRPHAARRLVRVHHHRPERQVQVAHPQAPATAQRRRQRVGDAPDGNASLEYDVGIVDAFPPEGRSSPAGSHAGAGSAKSAEIIRTDPLTGVNTFPGRHRAGDQHRHRPQRRQGRTAASPSAARTSGCGIFEPRHQQRNAPIPDGHYDGYTVILHEMAHSLGFASTRNALGELPSSGQYTFDEHITVFSPGVRPLRHVFNFPNDNDASVDRSTAARSPCRSATRITSAPGGSSSPGSSISFPTSSIQTFLRRRPEHGPDERRAEPGRPPRDLATRPGDAQGRRDAREPHADCNPRACSTSTAPACPTSSTSRSPTARCSSA